jgi:hypothetical protein
MISGFIFQITALRYGDLALVQPIPGGRAAVRLRLLAVVNSRRVAGRDLLAAAAIAGIGVFLPGRAVRRAYAPGSSWLLAGLVTRQHRGRGPGRGVRPGRRPARPGAVAAVLGAATGISWGFMAAVIKLSSHLGDGPGAVVSAWSLYLLIAAGAATCWPRTAAGPLAASRPGSPSWTRWRPACSKCSCSASTSGPMRAPW